MNFGQLMRLTNARNQAGRSAESGAATHEQASTIPGQALQLFGVLLLLFAYSPTAHAEPPTANNDGPINVPEDSINFLINAALNDSDIDGDLDPSTASVFSGPGNGSASSNGNGTFNYSPDPNFFGADSFVYQICDLLAACSTATVSINVTAVNDPPVSTPLGPQSATENVAYSLNVRSNFSDIDDANLTFTATGLPTSLTIGPANAVINGTPTQAEALFNGGIYNVTVTARDPSNASAQISFQLTVGAVNDAPTANPQNVSTNEDIALSITLTGTDPEGTTPLNFAIFSQPSRGTLSGTPPNMLYTPTANLNGADSFRFTVNDGQLTSAPATINIAVNPINDPPTVVLAIGNRTATENVFFSLNVRSNFTDVDLDTLTFTATGLPTSLTIGPANAVINGTPTQAEALFNGGIYNVTVTATDPSSQSVSNSFALTISPVNDPPVANNQNLATDEDIQVGIILTGSDPDGDPFTFTVATQPANGTLTGTVPNLTYTPNLNFNGADSFTFTTNDGLLTSVAGRISIRVDPVNDFPVLATPIPDQQAVEAAPFNLNISGNFVDVDGDTLTFTLGPNNLPASGNLRFNGNTGVFSGTPQFEDTTERNPLPPVFTVTVTATDALGQVVSDTFQITISALDRANLTLAIAVAPTPAMLNDQLQWTFTARNPMGPQAGANVELNGSFVGSGLTVSNGGTGGPCNFQSGGNQVTNFSCPIGAMPVGGNATIILSTATSDAGDVIAFATLAGTDPVPIDPNLEDNSSQIAVGVAEAFSNGAVQILGNSSIRSIAAGDVNNDGFTDIVVGTIAGQPIYIYLSGGFRDFAAVPITLNDTSAHEGLALADFDNNGTIDLAVAAGGGLADKVYANNGGAGIFSATPIATLQATFSQGVAAGDFNGDGNMDIAFATTQGNPVYLGNGSGGFTLNDVLGTANSLAVAAGKLDNNNRDDLVFANVGSASRVWTMTSGGVLSSRDQLNIGDATSVALANFGGDARPDLVFGRIPMGPADIAANPVLINTGNGTFGNPRNQVGSAPTADVLAGDVNGDGSPDLVFTNSNGLHQIWNANGNGFTLHREQIVDGGSLAGTLTELGMTDVGAPVAIDLAMGGPVASGVGVFLNDGFGNLGRGDAVPPTMVLNGTDPMEVPAGSAFVDPKTTAQDNIDGNISNAVVATGAVNTAIVGSYTVTYNVSDFAGNSALPISRTVIVTPSTGTGGGGGGSVSPLALLVAMGTFLIYYCLATKSRRRQPARLKNPERYKKEQ